MDSTVGGDESILSSSFKIYKPIRDLYNYSGICSFPSARQHYVKVEEVNDQTMSKISDYFWSTIQSVDGDKDSEHLTTNKNVISLSSMLIYNLF